MELSFFQKTALRVCALIVTAVMLFPTPRACAETNAPAPTRQAFIQIDQPAAFGRAVQAVLKG